MNSLSRDSLDAGSRLPATADVVIVGGGIWGLSTAWHLTQLRPDWHVVVVERAEELAHETTLQAAGQIGQLRSHPVMARGVGYTLQLLQTFRERTGFDPGIQTPGSLHLALQPDRWAAFTTQAERAAQSGSVMVRLVAPNEIQDYSPAIQPAAICGALFVAGDGYVNARQTALAYAQAAAAGGAHLRTGVTCLGIETMSNGQVERVLTNAGEVKTRQVVLAAGPWTALLCQELGISLPVHGIRLQQARTAPLALARVDHPVVRIPDASCYLRPEEGAFLFGFFDPQPLPLDPRHLARDWRTAHLTPAEPLVEQSRQALMNAIPCLQDIAIAQYRQGIVTCAPDGWYVLGPIRPRPGLWVATGCAAMGIAGSGAVGRWLSSWLVHGDPGESLELMAPDRLPQLAQSPTELADACCRTFAAYYSLTGGATYSMGQKS